MESRKPGVKDYYATLGVASASTPTEIKKAYRALAHRYHPDRIQNLDDVLAASERMVEINEAFEVLSDSKRRAAYDRELTAEKTPPPAKEAPPEDWEIPVAPAREDAARKAAPRNVAVDQTVAREFLDKVKAQLLQEGTGAKLREESEKGWLWSLLGKTWSGNYWVSMRLIPQLNPNSAREILTQLEALAGKRRSGWRNNFFVFLVGFQTLNEADTVLKLFRTFCNREENSTPKHLINIVVMDLNRRRSVLCGKRTGDDNLNSILRALAVS